MDNKKTTLLLCILIFCIMTLFLLKTLGVFSELRIKKEQPQENGVVADYNRESSGAGIIISSEPVINIAVSEDSPAAGFKPFYVYDDVGKKDNHFYASGFMGNISSLSLNQTWNEAVKSGKTCIKVVYNASVKGTDWAGLYWTEPANNWGGKPGFNLTGAGKLSFWARGEKGGEIISNFITGGIQGKEFEDSDTKSLSSVELSKEWKQYFISLEGADMKNIIGGFCFTITKSENPDGAVFYLDNIVYE